MTNKENSWVCSYSEHEERWQSYERFDTKEEAIMAGLEAARYYNENPKERGAEDVLNLNDELYGEPLTSFAVGYTQPVGNKVDVDWILETIAEQTLDEAGEWAEVDYLADVSKERKQELEDLIHGWLEKYDYSPNVFFIDRVETIELEKFEERVE